MSLQALAMRALLAALWERGNRRCGICGDALDIDSGQIDHVIPKSLGGPDTLENLQTAHRACNIRKGGVNKLSSMQIDRPYFRLWAAVPLEHRAAGFESTPAGACVAALRFGFSRKAPYRPCRARVTLEELCWTHWTRLSNDLERRSRPPALATEE